MRRAGVGSAKFRKGLMRRRNSRDERRGDLFGAPAPKPAAANHRRPAKRNLLEDPPAETVSLAPLAKHSSRHEIEDMINELDDGELAHLIASGICTLKRRLNRAGKGAFVLVGTVGGGARWIGPCRTSRRNCRALMSTTLIGDHSIVIQINAGSAVLAGAGV
jgi:hypothetical protein